MRFWSRSWPQEAVVESNTQYQRKVNLWAGMIGPNLIGPYVLEGNLTGVSYRNLLINRIIPDI